MPTRGFEGTHRVVDGPGRRVHVVEQGVGPLVVLVHGFPETWYSWRHQMGALAAAGYRAAAVDVTLGKGHFVAVTDSGWISNDALSGKGIADVAIKEQDNWEIFRRLVKWAAGH